MVYLKNNSVKEKYQMFYYFGVSVFICFIKPRKGGFGKSSRSSSSSRHLWNASSSIWSAVHPAVHPLYPPQAATPPKRRLEKSLWTSKSLITNGDSLTIREFMDFIVLITISIFFDKIYFYVPFLIQSLMRYNNVSL